MMKNVIIDLQKALYLFDVKSGKPFGSGVYKHNCDIIELSLNKTINGMGRYLAYLDRNNDLFLVQVKAEKTVKIGTMVETFSWNDDNDCLIAIIDGKLVEFYYPATAFYDEDMSPFARRERPR